MKLYQIDFLLKIQLESEENPINSKIDIEKPNVSEKQTRTLNRQFRIDPSVFSHQPIPFFFFKASVWQNKSFKAPMSMDLDWQFDAHAHIFSWLCVRKESKSTYPQSFTYLCKHQTKRSKIKCNGTRRKTNTNFYFCIELGEKRNSTPEKSLTYIPKYL